MEITWNNAAFRSNIEFLFGAKVRIQLGLCLESVLSRFQHVAFHIDQITQLLAEAETCNSVDIIKAVLYGEISGRPAEIRSNAEAHAIAAVQALHAISDSLGTLIALALRGDLGWKKYLRDVPTILNDDELEVRRLLTLLQDNDDYRYLDALTNQSKHKHVVEVFIVFSLTPLSPSESRFTPFERKGITYPEKKIIPFLNAEYARQAKFVMPIMLELDRLVSSGCSDAAS